MIATARRLLVLRLPSASAVPAAVPYARITLFAAGGVVVINHLVLAVGHDVFAAACADAVLLVLLLNLAAVHEARSDGRDNAAVPNAFGTLALIAAVPLAAAALPLRHASEATGTITIALPVAVAALYSAGKQGIRLRLFVTRTDARLQAASVVAVVPLGFCAYLLKAPTTDTSHVGAATAGLTALVLGAVAGELLFRGVVQASLTRALGSGGLVLATALSAALFTSVSWWMIPTLAAVTIFALVVAATGTIAPAVAAHVVFVVSAAVVWPRMLHGHRVALPISVPLCTVVAGGLLVVVAAFARNLERGRV